MSTFHSCRKHCSLQGLCPPPSNHAGGSKRHPALSALDAASGPVPPNRIGAAFFADQRLEDRRDVTSIHPGLVPWTQASWRQNRSHRPLDRAPGHLAAEHVTRARHARRTCGPGRTRRCPSDPIRGTIDSTRTPAEGTDAGGRGSRSVGWTVADSGIRAAGTSPEPVRGGRQLRRTAPAVILSARGYSRAPRPRPDDARPRPPLTGARADELVLPPCWTETILGPRRIVKGGPANALGPLESV